MKTPTSCLQRKGWQTPFTSSTNPPDAEYMFLEAWQGDWPRKAKQHHWMTLGRIRCTCVTRIPDLKACSHIMHGMHTPHVPCACACARTCACACACAYNCAGASACACTCACACVCACTCACACACACAPASVSMSLCLCVRVSVCPCVRVSVCPCDLVSVFLCVRVSVFLCVRVSVCLCVCGCWGLRRSPVHHPPHIFPSSPMLHRSGLGQRWLRHYYE